MRIWLEGREVTGLCVRGVTDKNAGAAAEEGRFSFVCAPKSGALPQIDPACGQWIVAREGEKTVFSGGVDKLRYDAGSRLVTAECFDPAIALTRTFPTGNHSGTAGEIVRELLPLCGLEAGQIAPGEERMRLFCPGDRSLFSLMGQLYPTPWVTDYAEGKLNVRLWGEEKASLEGAVLCGLTAGNRQSGAEIFREAVITAAGDTAVRCGQRITLDRPRLGVWGDYVVTRLRRTWEKGRMTVTMGLVSL